MKPEGYVPVDTTPSYITAWLAKGAHTPGGNAYILNPEASAPGMVSNYA